MHVLLLSCRAPTDVGHLLKSGLGAPIGIRIYLNAETEAVSVHADCILFQWKYSGDLLHGGGILILEEINFGKEVSDPFWCAISVAQGTIIQPF